MKLFLGDFPAFPAEQTIQEFLEGLLRPDHLQHLMEDVGADIPPVFLPAFEIRTIIRRLLSALTRGRGLLVELLPGTLGFGVSFGGFFGLLGRLEVIVGEGRGGCGVVGEAECAPTALLVRVDIDGLVVGGGGVLVGDILREIALKWQHRILILYYRTQIQGLVARFPHKNETKNSLTFTTFQTTR